ncbi:MAG TPA: nodulation protein NfeD [Myxococcota bacterium]|nr:nodulation protein NfeD [Myxococcota bacterium]
MKRLALTGLVLLGLRTLVASGAEPEAPAPAGVVPTVYVVVISGSINPASADHIVKGIARAEQAGAEALLLQLDTPGGLVESTKDVIQAMLNARVPVLVYVAPQGAWAGSAGTFITIAGHVAAMAPGTSIGAAHPVGIGAPGGQGGEEGKGQRDFALEKAENFLAAFIESIARERDRNVEWAVKAVRESVAIAQDEALELGVIDLVARDREELFAKSEGRKLKVAGGERVLHVVNARLHEIPMSWANRFLDALASPDVAILLILAGIFGLYTEFTNPGLVFPGVAGAICLVLGMVALQILPFSWYGLLLFLVGIGCFVAELFVTSYGALFAVGVVCFLLGGSMLFEMPELSDLRVSFWSVLVPAVTGLSLFMGLVLFAVGRSFRRPQIAGTGELLGMQGKAITALAPEGTVFLRGEYWNAHAEEPVAAGERVEVTAVDGLLLRVRRARPASPGA